MAACGDDALSFTGSGRWLALGNDAINNQLNNTEEKTAYILNLNNQTKRYINLYSENRNKSKFFISHNELTKINVSWRRMAYESHTAVFADPARVSNKDTLSIFLRIHASNCCIVHKIVFYIYMFLFSEIVKR